MNYLAIVLCIVAFGCGEKKHADTSSSDYMTRPDIYRISAEDAAALQDVSRGGGNNIPREFKSPVSVPEIRSNENSVRDDLRTIHGSAIRADQTLERIVSFSSWMLAQKGYAKEAAQIKAEYNARFKGFMVDRETNRDLGDHAPLLAWLDVWYVKLDALLGSRVMRIIHLEHIKILNFSIPVVFNPSGKDGDVWDIVEYRAHFAGTRRTYFYSTSEHDGFAGVVAYWDVWAGCTGMTYGIGGILPFLCSPVSEVSCFGMEKYLAPKISDFVFCNHNVCE